MTPKESMEGILCGNRMQLYLCALPACHSGKHQNKRGTMSWLHHEAKRPAPRQEPSAASPTREQVRDEVLEEAATALDSDAWVYAPEEMSSADFVRTLKSTRQADSANDGNKKGS